MTSTAFEWTGRHDGDGYEHARWHSVVRADLDTDHDVELIGFASDEGVRRNEGRIGAAEGPVAIRSALANLSAPGVRVADRGDVTVKGEDLESGQSELASWIAASIDRKAMPIVLGGGHETAWGSYQGIRQSKAFGRGKLGIINLDAHFDLRQADRPTSGSPFSQIAEAEAARNQPFSYTVLGISEPNNSFALFARTQELGVSYVLDEDCTPETLPDLLRYLDSFMSQVDHVYLTVDLDVLPASDAPGVSAPAALGVAPRVILEIVKHLADAGKLCLVDVVELNPRFDIDSRTAKFAARLVHEVARREAD
ncbi:formimidoylglutamase [Haematomicrobium sanguinis]|uniref:formimidoylglutamase n=1 Tax=Haematomicrobium sanguinis TaxID=479106 RepID=UPI000551E9BD|nr:formimidoylglutamase [Haematomicrobium sanguinis]